MEISNILKEIKSRGLPASQTIILEFARRRYEMEEESVNELLNKMSENGELIVLKDKNVQFYRLVESSLGKKDKEEKEVTGDGETRRLSEVNLLYESFDCFKEDIYKKIAKMDNKTPTTTPTTEQNAKQHEKSNHEANRMIRTLKEENARMKKELKTKQEVINRLMGKTEKKDITREADRKDSQAKPQSTQQETNEEKKKKKYIEVVGDSMINGFEERGLCKGNHVKVRKHPGASSTDFIDHVKPVLRKKPDTIIIHVGTNDLTNNINLIRNVKMISKMTKEESPSTKLCFSSVVNRYDIERGTELVEEVNRKLKNYCNQNDHDFINNDNIREGDLGKRKLHPNKKGLKLLVKNILEYLS